MRHFNRNIYEKSLLGEAPHVDKGIPVSKMFPFPQICWTKLGRWIARSEVEKMAPIQQDVLMETKNSHRPYERVLPWWKSVDPRWIGVHKFLQ